MKTPCICSYVHGRKPRRSLQGHSGSFISRDGAFREVRWKVEAKIQAPGGTPRKNWTYRTPMALGSGAAPSAMHILARRPGYPAALLRLWPSRQDAEEGTQVPRNRLP